MKVALIIADNREEDRNYTAREPYFSAAPTALIEGFAGIPELEIHVLSCAQKPLKSPEKLADNIWFEGLYVPKVGWMKTSYQGCIRAIRRRLKVIQPDIVHGQGTERECAVGATFSRLPNVLTIHGNMTEQARLFNARLGTDAWLAGQLETIALGRTRGVFCNSAYTESLVAPRTKYTWRVPNAIREPFLATPLPQTVSGRCVMLNVGAIGERKRQVELLETARKLHEMGLEFDMQFIGAADEKDEYCRTFLGKIRDAESRGYARHIGVKSAAELVACMDAAHRLVHFPGEEAFGLAAAEGLARNLKFFGSRLGGIPDIAAGSADAELIDGNDWDGLARAIAAWIRNGHPRANDSARFMAGRYQPQLIARRHLEIYRDVLGRN